MAIGREPFLLHRICCNDVLQKCSACNRGRQKAHGAPIQCTKGKCTKSFHVSCAREGQNGVSYTILREVEKEVILVDMQPASSHVPRSSGGTSLSDGVSVAQDAQPNMDVEPHVLKTIKKNEVQVLCNQHNPVSIWKCSFIFTIAYSVARPSRLRRKRISRTRSEMSLLHFRQCLESRFA
jgi:hypothetical protein